MFSFNPGDSENSAKLCAAACIEKSKVVSYMGGGYTDTNNPHCTPFAVLLHCKMYCNNGDTSKKVMYASVLFTPYKDLLSQFLEDCITQGKKATWELWYCHISKSY
ncbi:MAG: hypothetical protein ACTJLM_05515 [Ehrlichia sp.]